jgi:CRP-like cAMP-binding protein
MVPILSHATAEELYEVAAIAREIPIADQEVLFSAGAPAWIGFLLAGSVELTNAEGAGRKVEPGSAFGVRETLAGASFLESARALTSGRALQIDREPLFDLLSDRMDLLQGIFSAVFHRKGGDQALD